MSETKNLIKKVPLSVILSNAKDLNECLQRKILRAKALRMTKLVIPMFCVYHPE